MNSIACTYLTGLAVVHLAWFYFFTTGQLLRSRSQEEQGVLSLVELVATSAAGMALVGFGLLLLGLTHLLNHHGIFGGLVLEGLLFWWLRRENWFSWRFWRDTFRRMLQGWTPVACFIYVLFLFLGLPAMVPPIGGDAATYHLAYAVDWANAGHIYVDRFLRFPFYANNFLLLYSAFFVLKLGRYCEFLTWLCGLLSCLGVLAFFVRVDKGGQSQHSIWAWFQPQEFLIPLGVALSPAFLRYLNVAYVDVPIGLFVLVPLLCAYRGSKQRPLERELVVAGAFCAGMKLTLIGLVPLFIASLFFCCARRLPRRKIAWLCLALLALSLPWYVRNLIATGDPVPPLFNTWFHHSDPVYTAADMELYSRDFRAPRDPIHLLLLPFRFFADPESKDFGEWGVSAMVVLLYAPMIFLIAQLSPDWRRRSPPQLVYLSAALTYLVVPWFFSSAGRHALHWYPVLAAWLGAVVSYLSGQAEARWSSPPARLSWRLAEVIFCCAVICPLPSHAALFFYRSYDRDTAAISASREQLKFFVKNHVRAYREARAVIEALRPQHRKDRVFVFGRGTPPLYFRDAKIVSMGDYFGPGRYGDLNDAVMQGNCRPYLDRLRISAIIVEPRMAEVWGTMYARFRTELAQNGFTEYRCHRCDMPVFLRSDISPSHRLIRVTADPPAPLS
jgi:hypothetical protein